MLSLSPWGDESLLPSGSHALRAEKALLKTTPLFGHLVDGQIERALALAARIFVRRGQALFSEGDAPERVYVLLSGAVQFFVTDSNGRRLVNGIARKGVMPGLVSYIDGSPQECSCLADEDAELLVFSRADLVTLFDSADGLPTCPMVRGELMHQLVSIIHKLMRQTRQLALMDVYSRVRILFERMANESDGRVVLSRALTQQEIADMIGSSREMVARILKELVYGHYIRVEHRVITILKPLPENF